MNRIRNLQQRKVVCIIQARMSSSRLPGKVLEDICEKPMLAWVVDRSSKSGLIDQIIIATTENKNDDPIKELCDNQKWFCYRGSEFDVLDRYYQVSRITDAGIIVRLTADCPLIDPQLIDRTIETLIENQADFAANRLPPPYHRTYPIGLDVEAATFEALDMAWRNAELPFEREHVMPYLYDPENKFNIKLVNHAVDLGALRWTVDTLQDLEFIRQLLLKIDCREDFTWIDVLGVIERNPELSKINAEIVHKTLKEIDPRAKKK